jgi:predicted DNA-binding transcriptional regulator AlpA
MVFLRLPELEALGIDLCDRTLRRLEAAGQFPQRVKLGRRRVFWRKTDIDAWLASHSA